MPLFNPQPFQAEIRDFLPRHSAIGNRLDGGVGKATQMRQEPRFPRESGILTAR